MSVMFLYGNAASVWKIWKAMTTKTTDGSIVLRNKFAGLYKIYFWQIAAVPHILALFSYSSHVTIVAFYFANKFHNSTVLSTFYWKVDYFLSCWLKQKKKILPRLNLRHEKEKLHCSLVAYQVNFFLIWGADPRIMGWGLSQNFNSRCSASFPNFTCVKATMKSHVYSYQV